MLERRKAGLLSSVPSRRSLSCTSIAWPVADRSWPRAAATGNTTAKSNQERDDRHGLSSDRCLPEEMHEGSPVPALCTARRTMKSRSQSRLTRTSSRMRRWGDYARSNLLKQDLCSGAMTACQQRQAVIGSTRLRLRRANLVSGPPLLPIFQSLPQSVEAAPWNQTFSRSSQIQLLDHESQNSHRPPSPHVSQFLSVVFTWYECVQDECHRQLSGCSARLRNQKFLETCKS